MSAKVAGKRATVDWEGLESHYRAGVRSLKDMGREFEVSDAAIVKHARKNGWTRNLAAKIQAKADAKVSAAQVSAEVSASGKVSEALRVEVESEVQARVRLAHRKDIARARALAMSLLEQLEQQTGNIDGLAQLGELVSADKRVSDKMMTLYHGITSLPGRTKTMKDLGDTLHKLIGLEREAYSIGDQPPPPPAPAGATGTLILPLDPIEAARMYLEVMGEKAP